jgi:MoaA/NifB/PqqE/SkfB family radical SAM enzyme
MEVADRFAAQGMQLELLTSGLALERLAEPIAARFRTVTISLDGHTPELYRQIRGVDGYEVVVAGVRRLRALAPHVGVRARSTLHRLNFRFLPDLVARSREIGLDQISFLAADVSSDAFNRGASLPQADRPPPQLLLDHAEVAEFERTVEATIRRFAPELEARQVAPGPDGLRRLPRYYRAHLGAGAFPPVDCNAPWMSVMIEANGGVRPCFFHPVAGNLRERPLAEILGRDLPRFRRRLDVGSDGTCQRCVCTIKVGLRSQLF